MNNQELEQQLLSLDLAERIRILQLLAQSLTVPSASQPSRSLDELELSRDRSPQHPLRGIPITIPPDFDEPMPELWDALEIVKLYILTFWLAACSLSPPVSL